MCSDFTIVTILKIVSKILKMLQEPMRVVSFHVKIEFKLVFLVYYQELIGLVV